MLFAFMFGKHKNGGVYEEYFVESADSGADTFEVLFSCSSL